MNRIFALIAITFVGCFGGSLVYRANIRSNTPQGLVTAHVEQNAIVTDIDAGVESIPAEDRCRQFIGLPADVYSRLIVQFGCAGLANGGAPTATPGLIGPYGYGVGSYFAPPAAYPVH